MAVSTKKGKKGSEKAVRKMAVSTKKGKKGSEKAVRTKKVKITEVVQQEESDQSSDLDSESGENMDNDMVEPKTEIDSDISGSDIEKINDEDNSFSTVGLTGESDLEIKEEVSSEPALSDDDNDMEDDEMNHTNTKEKRVRIATEESDESDSDLDQEDEEDISGEESGSEKEDSKTGLANVMAEILATPGGSNLILSKAKKDHMARKPEETGEFEFVDKDGNVKQEVKLEVVDEELEEDEEEKARLKQRLKHQLALKFKSRPNFETDRVKERELRIIATQGVVQLFTAIEKHKALLKKNKPNSTKSIFDREESSAKSMKASFMKILDTEGEKLKESNPVKNTKRKSDIKKEDVKKPKWNVFADNFYKEPTLQGWNLESDEEKDPL